MWWYKFPELAEVPMSEKMPWKLDRTSYPPDCECTWCAGRVHHFHLLPHLACTWGWSPRWWAQISTERNLTINSFCRQTTGCTWISSEARTSFRNLSIHLVISILRIALSKMSIYGGTECEHLQGTSVKIRCWRHNRTHRRFKSLIIQKRNKRNNFTGRVWGICDENIPCQQKLLWSFFTCYIL